MDLDKHGDVIRDYRRVEQTRVGNILDAQDYLENWHLAIVIDEKNGNSSERRLHFLPFSNAKRDETFSDEHSNKIAPIFTHTEIPSDPEKAFSTLREYLSGYKPKTEEKKKAPPSLAPSQSAPVTQSAPMGLGSQPNK